LLGQQCGYTKYSRFICLWDSWARNDHWVKKGNHQEIPRELVKLTSSTNLQLSEKIIIPLPRMKLAQFDEAVRKVLPATGDCFNYISRTFPALTIEKPKAFLMVRRSTNS